MFLVYRRQSVKRIRIATNHSPIVHDVPVVDQLFLLIPLFSFLFITRYLHMKIYCATY